MIYAPPTVADLDGDGRLVFSQLNVFRRTSLYNFYNSLHIRKEVIVGTALGLLYVMDGESGFVRRFFPMQFNSIQAAVSVADVTGDRDLEMIVLDMGGTVALVDLKGEVLWDAHLSGTLPFPATVGDVDGDGQVDVVVVAATEGKGSHIYALRGDTGAVLPGYPIVLPGNAVVSSPVLLVDLFNSHLLASKSKTFGNGTAGREAKLRRPVMLGSVDDPFPAAMLATNPSSEAAVEARKGLHLVVTSFDGSIFVVDSTSSLVERPAEKEDTVRKFHAQRIDVGEHVYCVPLLDDVTGDGYLDLLVGTLNGQLLLFESSIPHDPRNTWSAFPNHRLNSVTHGQMGIAVPFEEKEKMELLDIKGNRNLSLVFDIWDLRYDRAVAGGVLVPDVEYTVSITRGTNRLQPLWTHKFSKPGKYVAHVPVSPPEISLFVLSMSSDHGEYFEDTVHVALSTKFYLWVKYLLVTPLLVLCLTVMSRYRRKI